MFGASLVVSKELAFQHQDHSIVKEGRLLILLPMLFPLLRSPQKIAFLQADIPSLHNYSSPFHLIIVILLYIPFVFSNFLPLDDNRQNLAAYFRKNQPTRKYDPLIIPFQFLLFHLVASQNALKILQREEDQNFEKVRLFGIIKIQAAVLQLQAYFLHAISDLEFEDGLQMIGEMECCLLTIQQPLSLHSVTLMQADQLLIRDKQNDRTPTGASL